MNTLQKIEKILKDHNSRYLISGSQRTRIKYSKLDENIYKIIAISRDDIGMNLFEYLVKDKTRCHRYELRLFGYFAIWEDESFRLEIEENFNGYNTICVYKK